jgi:hypothetical protein
MKYNTAQTKFSSENSTEPVTLAEAKNWIKVDAGITDDDALITELIKVARQQCEGFLGISLIERTVTAVINNSAGGAELPYGPVVSFTSLKDVDDNALTEVLQGLDFKTLKTPLDDYMTAVYTTGYPDGVPLNFKTAIKEQVAWLYDGRGEDKELSATVLQNLKPYRRVE